MMYATATGLGQSTQQIGGYVSAGTSIAAGLLALSPAAGPAAPFVALAGVITALITSLIGKPNEYKIATTNVVNQLEPYFQQNVNTWLALPASQKTQSAQAAAISNFNQLWAAVEQYCGQIATENIQGSSGSGASASQACIGDREQGSCIFKTAIPVGWQGTTFEPSTNTSGWNVWNGTNNSKAGSCWNWFIGYLDPIQNDPNVIPDPVGSVATGLASDVSSITGLSTSTIFLLGGVALLGFVLLSNIKV